MRQHLEEISVVRGWPETVETLDGWRRRPGRVLPWFVVSFGVAVLLMVLVYLVARASAPAPHPPERFPTDPSLRSSEHLLQLVRNNSIVLALHAVACLAGYVVHMALVDPSTRVQGQLAAWTRVTALAALLFVPMATLLSISTQSWLLGSYAATLASYMRLPISTLLFTVAPHSLIELTAIFLPLAAWLVLRVRGRGEQLFAATLVSTIVAVPMLFGAAWIETYQWPHRLDAAQRMHPIFTNFPLTTLDVDPTDSFYTAKIELQLGAPVNTKPDSTIDAALRHAHEAAGGSTVAIIRSTPGFYVYRVLMREIPGFCDRIANVPQGSSHVFRLADLGAARMPHDFHMLAGPQVVELLDARTATTLELLRAPVQPQRSFPFSPCQHRLG